MGIRQNTGANVSSHYDEKQEFVDLERESCANVGPRVTSSQDMGTLPELAQLKETPPERG
eukprot:4082767-Pyramimonas_sp.AAC.1